MTRKFSPRFSASLVLALVFVGACTQPDEGPLFDPASTSSVAQIADRYIVVLNRAPDGQVATASAVAATMGVTVDLHYRYALSGFAAELTPSQVASLEASPLVAFVERDQIMTKTTTQSPTPSWGLDRVDQQNLPLDNSYTYPNGAGAGVHFYGLDTGILGSHNDFTGRMGNGISFIPGSPSTTDCDGHGTHTASTAAGATYGVSKSATVHPVRVLDCNGSGFTSWVVGGIDWVRQNAPSGSVANMSLSGGASTALDQAVAAAVNAGTVFTVSAGNNNFSSCLRSPAREPLAITVGSTTITDARSGFSNFGTCNDLFGPGSSIIAAYIGGNNATQTLSGTSMSAPHVAGVAILHRAANPGDSPGQVAAAITSNATSGIVSNPGSGSPNLLLNMSYLNGGPPPPGGVLPDSAWWDAATGTVGVSWEDTSSVRQQTAEWQVVLRWAGGGSKGLLPRGPHVSPNSVTPDPGNNGVQVWAVIEGWDASGAWLGFATTLDTVTIGGGSPTATTAPGW